MEKIYVRFGRENVACNYDSDENIDGGDGNVAWNDTDVIRRVLIKEE